MNHYTYRIWQSSNLRRYLSCDMNHYTHLYGNTVINANRIRSMVNLTLETRVRYPLYIVIYCKRVHYTADSLVWGSLRLDPIIIIIIIGVTGKLCPVQPSNAEAALPSATYCFNPSVVYCKRRSRPSQCNLLLTPKRVFPVHCNPGPVYKLQKCALIQEHTYIRKSLTY